MTRLTDDRICCWLVALFVLTLGASSTLAEQTAPSSTPEVRDHRRQPGVRDHRRQPEVRDHRTPPEVRDHRGNRDVALDKAVSAALNGPDVTRLAIRGHEFNVKKATVKQVRGGTTIEGQISHHLTGRPDDQVYYLIQKSGNTVTSVEITIRRGAETTIVRYHGRIASGLLGRAIPSNAESLLRELVRLVDGSWASSADLIVAGIALRAKVRSPSAPWPLQPNEPAVRDHRPQPVVRDHRAE